LFSARLGSRYALGVLADLPAAGVDQQQLGEPSRARGAAAWKPWTVGLAFIGILGLVLTGRAIVGTRSGDGEGSLLAIGIALILLELAPIGLVLLLAYKQGRPTAADFGLRRPPLGRSIGLAVAFWIGLTAVTILWVAALGLDDDEGQALTERLGTEGTLTVVILIVVVTILAPVEEEFLFRGYIFRALRNWRGVWPAAIATGGLFAATHIGWLPIAFMVPILLIGIGLCLLYHWTGSLYPGIALHAFNNSIPLGTALNWSWQIPVLIVGSTLAALTIAWLLARLLGDRPPRPGEERPAAVTVRA